MNKIPNKIGKFIKDDSETTMKYGYYYKCEMDVPFSNDKSVLDEIPYLDRITDNPIRIT